MPRAGSPVSSKSPSVLRTGFTLLAIAGSGGVGALVQVPAVLAQVKDTASTPCKASPDTTPGVGEFPVFTIKRLSAESTKVLRDALRAGCFEKALETYYSGSRRPEFVNWVVYIAADTVLQAIMQHRRPKNVFRGEKYVWVTVFSDTNLKPAPNLPPGTADTADLTFGRRSTNYQRDALLGSLYKTFVGKILGGDLPTSSVAIDSVRTLEFAQLSDDSTRPPFYVAQGRFGLAENTTVVLSLAPALKKRFPGRTRAVYANLGNAARSRYEVGLGVGAEIGSRSPVISDTVQTGETASVRPNLYLLLHANLSPPALPWRRTSFGLVVGTNLIRGSLLDEVVTAASFGRLLGDAGLVAGVTWQSETRLFRTTPTSRAQRRERRIPRLILAVDFRL